MLSSPSTRATSSKKLPNAWGLTVGDLWGAIVSLLQVEDYDMSTGSYGNTYYMHIPFFWGHDQQQLLLFAGIGVPAAGIPGEAHPRSIPQQIGRWYGSTLASL